MADLVGDDVMVPGADAEAVCRRLPETEAELHLRHLKYDAGFGVSLWLGVHTMLRLDVAFFSGEGCRVKPFSAGF
jgi:hypothetical protein